jgi:golgi phosphoprotein 3
MTTKDDGLALHEAALLLALRDEKGTIASGPMYQYALGGGILAELILGGRLAVDTEGRKDWLRVVSTRKTGDPVLDECLDAVAAAPRRKTVQTWVTKFSRTKRLKHRIAERLCDRRVLRKAEDSVLFVFSRTVYPEVDHGPEGRLVERIRKAVLSDDGQLDPRLVVIIALAHHTDLLKGALTRKEIRARKARLEAIENGDVVGKAVKGAVDAMRTAIMVAAITPAICASAAH